jgi:hypothetical protein
MKLNKFFKKKTGITNIHHQDFEDKTEWAFKLNGTQFHRFKKETSMPFGRYMYLQTFLYEQNLRIDVKMLNAYMEKLTKVLNGNKGVIELGKAFQVIGQIQSRCELAFEVDTTYRLASVLYFDDTEDLYSYDKAYNDQKIAAWKEAKAVDFFYMMPMSEFLNLNDLSPADLVSYMDVQKTILEELT